MAKVYRIGIIGSGNIATHAHIPAYVETPNALVVGLYDVDKGRAENARATYLRLMAEKGREIAPEAVKVYDSAEELLKNTDAADVCTTLRYHAYYADLAMSMGVPAMSEKPMARTYIEAAQVEKREKETGVPYQLNDDNLFLPRYQVMRNVVESGLIGEVRGIRIARGSFSVNPTRADWFYDPIVSGGGCIMDYGSHAVCSTWYIVGYDKVPQKVKATAIEVRDRTKFSNGRFVEMEVDDSALFRVLYEDPLNGNWVDCEIEATWTWPRMDERSSDVGGYIEVRGSMGKASAEFDESGAEYIRVISDVFGEKRIPVPVVGSEEYSFQQEISNFLKCLDEKKPSILRASRASQFIRILNAAQLSKLYGCRAVAMEELDAFEEAFCENDPWRAGDEISVKLNQPHKKPAAK